MSSSRDADGPVHHTGATLHWESLSVTLLAGGAAVAFLGLRLTVPAECALLHPMIGVFRDDGVVPDVPAGCPLPAGVVTDAVTEGGLVELTVDGTVMVLERAPQAGVIAVELWDAGGTIVFVAVLLALSTFATARRPSDPSVASNLAFTTALFGSTLVTMVGIPPS